MDALLFTRAVDHNHETGMIRGLLCSHCNVMIGWAKEDVRRLKAAAIYLEMFNGKD